jgi:glycosyltransferase involved in cell wall biosynthesis
VHILDGSHAYLANLLPRRLRVVATVHDLIPLLTDRGELAGPLPSLPARLLWWLSKYGLRRADRLVAVSASTANALLRLCRVPSERVSVVHNPVCAPQLPDRRPETDGRGAGTELAGRIASLSAPMLLHVGHNAAYKNRAGVLRVTALVARGLAVRLVLVGSPPTPALRQLAADLGLGSAVEWRCDVPDAELQDLYRQAGVLLFPSRYEGFGWPPLEAMANGCPVVCSNAASLPEVVGDAALTAAPEDYEQLARYCLDLLRQPDLRADLVRRGFANLERFTLRRFGDQLAAVYAAALGPG